MLRTVAQPPEGTGHAPYPPVQLMSPFWIWMQALIVLFTLASIVIAITKLV